jgi:cardiolipin synthase
MERYIIQRGEIARRYVDALAERARTGVKVNVMADAMGSSTTPLSFLDPICRAGGRFAWFHPLRLNTLLQFNNRSHREVLIVDGKIAFLGGAGVADHWYLNRKGKPRWRDTMVRVEGDAVCNLQATFAENWIEAAGEVLSGEEYFPIHEKPSDSLCMVVNSMPSIGGATRARVLMQLLIGSARQSIHITTPYFLPDKGMSDELKRAMRDRGVEVKILLPGAKSDHILTRASGLRKIGGLLKAGAQVFEYLPAMIHAKILTVDGLWSVVGSTNFDHRSFGINDEVNLAACDAVLTARLEEDLARDLRDSRQITLERWRHRSLLERIPELAGWPLEWEE